MIDLDAVRKQKQRGWTDPMGYLRGQLPLTAAGVLITQNGVGRFQLESAEISGVAVPKSVLQELLVVLLADAREPARHQHGRPIRAARRGSRRSASGEGRSDGGPAIG